MTNADHMTTLTIKSYKELEWTPAGVDVTGYQMADYFADGQYKGVDVDGVGLAHSGRPLVAGEMVKLDEIEIGYFADEELAQ